MEKKLTAQGPKKRKSYTVTLPIDWIKKQKLEKTKKVELEVVGNKIVISPNKEFSEQEFIEGEKYEKVIIKVIQGLYRVGVDEVKISYNKPKLLQSISDIVDSLLIGYEIVEQKNNYLIIKDLTGECEENFDTLIRRIFLLLVELTGMKEKEEIDSTDKNIKKLVNYCQRALVKRGYHDYLKIPFYYILLDQLEKLKDEYNWLLTNPIKIKDKKLFKEINHYTRKTYELYYKFNISDYSINELRTYEIKSKIKNSKNITVFDMHIHNIARLINSICGNIFVLKHKK